MSDCLSFPFIKLLKCPVFSLWGDFILCYCETNLFISLIFHEQSSSPPLRVYDMDFRAVIYCVTKTFAFKKNENERMLNFMLYSVFSVLKKNLSFLLFWRQKKPLYCWWLTTKCNVTLQYSIEEDSTLSSFGPENSIYIHSLWRCHWPKRCNNTVIANVTECLKPFWGLNKFMIRSFFI